MDQTRTRRMRGFRLTPHGWQRLHEARGLSEIHNNRTSRYTLEDLSGLTGFDPSTVAKVLAAEEGVDKQTLLRFFSAFGLELLPADYSRPENPQNPGREVYPAHHQDWSEAVDVSVFYGRTAELATLERWIVQERCRMVVLLGMGGIGKTALSVKLARQVQDDFDYLIWRSLRNAPMLGDLLAELIQFLCAQQPVDLPATVEGRISRLLECLRNCRCLLILDNGESILRREEKVGTYREGYEKYGSLFERLAEVPHKSCLVLTSREKPHEVASLEGATLPVRSLRLDGLDDTEGEEILKAKGLTTRDGECSRLVERYQGNPLALKIVATSIRELFGGDVGEFLHEETVIFNGVRHLLDEQFDRLPAFERQVMYWLAIDRELVSASQLRSDMVPPASVPKLLEALESLLRRSLIEHRAASSEQAAGFTQQPVVMEYTTEHFIAQICAEIEGRETTLFKSHALLKAQAKDYIRETQTRLLLEPVVGELLSRLGTQSNLENRLLEILAEQRERLPLEPGYVAGNILNLLCKLQADLSDKDFSRLAVWQANLQKANLVRVNFSQSDLSGSAFAQTFGNFLCVQFSPDGRLLAIGDDSGEVRLWGMESGQQLSSCRGHTDWICSIAFSPDGQMLASCSEDKTVKLWDVRTGQCLRTLQGHSGWVYAVAFSPDSRLLASGSPDRAVRLWDVQTGQCLSTLQGHSEWVYAVAFHPDGQMLASGSGDQTLKLWDVQTGRCLDTLHGHTAQVLSVSFDASGRTLASSSRDQTVRLWDVQTGHLDTLRGHTDQVRTIAFSPDGQLLASGGGDDTVKLWDVQTGQCLRTLHGHASWIWSLAFAPNGKTLASGGLDQTVRLWDVQMGQCLKILQGHASWAWSIVFSPDGKTLISGSSDWKVKLWDIESGRFRTLSDHTGWVWSVACAPDGQTLASGSFDETVRLWDVQTGRCRATLKDHTGWIRSVAFSPDGQTLASGSSDRTVKLWEVDSGRCLATLPGHTGWVWSVAFSPDGRVLASGGGDQTVMLWDMASLRCLRTLSGHVGSTWFVAFSPDSATLVSGGADGMVKLWDVCTGECLRTLPGHTGSVWSVAFSPDGQMLASSSHDRTARLWDVETGCCLGMLEGHTSQVCSVIFSPDGQSVATNSQDATTRLWDSRTGKCLKVLRAERPYEGMNIAGVTGLTEAHKAVLKALGAIE
ncbi:MAG: NACHT domain-containing protein [Gemmatimonadaceae bacterium]|nr:NACHT domain-containing protein [Gloeobacterales cyanobacterium ES-bin-141]